MKFSHAALGNAKLNENKINVKGKGKERKCEMQMKSMAACSTKFGIAHECV